MNVRYVRGSKRSTCRVTKAGARLLFQAFAIKDLDLPAAGMNEPGRLEARCDR
jgi:hypothetical protein